MSKVFKSTRAQNRVRSARYAVRHPVQVLQTYPAAASIRNRARSFRDHVTDVRAGASNAWYRAAGHRIHGVRAGVSNRRNRRTLERGRAPRSSAVNAAVSSRMPVYRNRINRAHGNRHREDARLHRAGNESLARMAPQRQRDAQAARTRGRVR